MLNYSKTHVETINLDFAYYLLSVFFIFETLFTYTPRLRRSTFYHLRALDHYFIMDSRCGPPNSEVGDITHSLITNYT